MFKKTIVGISFAKAARSKTQAMTHELMTTRPEFPFAQRMIQWNEGRGVQEKSQTADATCFPGVAKMYDSYEDAIWQEHDLPNFIAEWYGTMPYNEFYSDPTFTGWGSLYEDWQDDGDAQDWEFDGYKRVRDLDDAGGDFSLWGPYGIRPEGVAQGSLGDCWFLAAASSLAEVGSRVLDVFSGRLKQPNGLYVVKFYVMGEPKYMLVDDTLPTNSYGGLIMSQRSDEGAWWVPILEKAYAKFNYNYAALKSGAPAEAFGDLTGMPVETFGIGLACEAWSDEEILDLIRKVDEKGYMMVGGTYGSYYGLVDTHAYTIMGISDETYEGESGEEVMIDLRNPWSSEQYYGPGSDQEDDGKISMPLSSFIAGFYRVDVMYYADWKWATLGPLQWEKNEAPWSNFEYTIEHEFEITVKQDVAIQVEIPSHRQMGSDPSCNMWMKEDGTPIEVWVQVWQEFNKGTPDMYEEMVYSGEYLGEDAKYATDNLGGLKNRATLVFDDGPSHFAQLEPGDYYIMIGDWDGDSIPGAEYSIRTFGSETEIIVKKYNWLNAKSSSRDSDYVEDMGTIFQHECESNPHYLDVFGDSCSAYEGERCNDEGECESNSDRCGNFDRVPRGLQNSNLECCACGGGSYDGLGYPPLQHEDSTTATDQFGSNCNWYYHYPETCGQYDTDTFKSCEDCPVTCWSYECYLEGVYD